MNVLESRRHREGRPVDEDERRKRLFHFNPHQSARFSSWSRLRSCVYRVRPHLHNQAPQSVAEMTVVVDDVWNPSRVIDKIDVGIETAFENDVETRHILSVL